MINFDKLPQAELTGRLGNRAKQQGSRVVAWKRACVEIY